MSLQIIPGTIANATIQGKVYGICHRTSTFVLQYNKDVLKKAGIDPSPDKQPKTWDDLLANIAKVTGAGKGEFYGYAVQGEGSFGLGPAYRITPWLRQVGTEIATLDGATLKFNDPKSFPVWEYVREQFKYSPPGLAFVGDEGKIISQLYQGKVGYQPAHSFYIAGAKDAGADAGYVPLPLPKGGKRGNALVANFIYSALSGSKNKDAANDFCIYLGDKDVQLKGSEVGRIPSNKLALQDPNVFKGYPDAEPLKVYVDALVNDDEAPLPSFPKNPQKIWTVWNTSMSKVLQTTEPIKQIWDAAQQEAESYQK